MAERSHLRRCFLVAVLLGLGAGYAASASGAAGSTVIPDPVFSVPSGGTQAVSDTTNDFGGSTEWIYNADGSLAARRDTDSLGRPIETEFLSGDEKLVIYSLYQDSNDERQERPVGRSRLPLASCGAADMYIRAYSVVGTLGWKYNSSGVPPSLSGNPTGTLQALKDARSEWANVIDWCGIADSAALTFSYNGSTSVAYGNNGVNTVNWGSPSCGTGAVACTRVESSGTQVVETDTLLKIAATCAVNGSPGALDLQGVFAHETGHSIGFGDISSPTNVMNGTVTVGDTSNQLLGKGDATAVNSKY